MDGRRCYNRIQRQIKIKWKNSDVTVDGVTLDICPGGVFVVSNQPPPPKSPIDIELCIDGGSPRLCQGEVSWVNRGQVMYFPPGFGVQFLDMDEGLFDQLISMCTDPDIEGI